MRVAVVIPCFDDGATLGDALASVEAQEPHELVVVDDGSTEPETLETLRELEASGVRVVRRPNGGLSAARMSGVAATTAPYVMPLDADDALEPGALAALADALDAHPRAAVAWGDVRIWGEFDTAVRVADRFDPWRLLHLNEIPGTSMVRRSALLEVGGWQLPTGYEDWDLWLAFAEHGLDGVYVPVAMLRYRRQGGRMLADCIPRHAELYGEIQRRHPRLFAGRRRAWLHSRAPLRLKLLFPLVGAVPGLDQFDRHRLFQFVSKPGQTLRMRRLRRRAAPAS